MGVSDGQVLFLNLSSITMYELLVQCNVCDSLWILKKEYVCIEYKSHNKKEKEVLYNFLSSNASRNIDLIETDLRKLNTLFTPHADPFPRMQWTKLIDPSFI